MVLFVDFDGNLKVKFDKWRFDSDNEAIWRVSDYNLELVGGEKRNEQL